jgi:hypothetical protein
VLGVAHADKVTVSKIVTDNIDRESCLHTDESRLYLGADMHFASHETVKHSVGEYIRGDVHTNSAEGYFGIFKRGMKGVYQHCGEAHLQLTGELTMSANIILTEDQLLAPEVQAEFDREVSSWLSRNWSAIRDGALPELRKLALALQSILNTHGDQQ